MEWRVFFTRGVSSTSRPTALIQICDKDMIVLIHISAMESKSSCIQFSLPANVYLCQTFHRKSKSVSLPMILNWEARTLIII